MAAVESLRMMNKHAKSRLNLVIKRRRKYFPSFPAKVAAKMNLNQNPKVKLNLKTKWNLNQNPKVKLNLKTK